ncbi:FMN-dependent NADH-azoreductase [Bosea lupini]|uniref:FMN dependent NADH:quinone oxidoreductase n=1 Tax=Bosea lupini TaxID=1036779 RepID=A0A1H7U0D4_9HYPH|nr:NAD(P)H-dependent oxidoreductase [Bosea lupini]SEL90249.1 FMN-dependent NADH-azoreductase [Bosea lupini]
MTTLLHLDASARGDRSLSRALSRAFVEAWLAREPDANVIARDVGRDPPPFLNEAWVAAAFTPEEARTPQHKAELSLSDELIAELAAADVIVMGTPMYNYGMPAQLKSWFDKIIRIGKTFSFDLARGDFPLEPILSGKTLVVLSSRGEFGFGPGGVRADMNQLDPHIRTCSHYLGVESIHTIAIDYQEFGDARHKRSIAEAHAAVPGLVDELIAGRRAEAA